MSRESWLRTGERSKRRGEGSDFGMIDAGKFLRRGVSDDSAIFEKNDARGEKERFAKVVGDKDDGFAETAGEGAEFPLKLGAGDGIESAERLVHEENGRIGGKGASDADALTLAAGEFVRSAIAVPTAKGGCGREGAVWGHSHFWRKGRSAMFWQP